MGPLDNLAELDTNTGAIARASYDQPALPTESPADTGQRLMRQDIVSQRDELRKNQQFAQQQRVNGADFASRSIPTYRDDSGAVQPVTDSSGTPLTNFDKKNSNAWDSMGQPMAVNYQPSGPPEVKPAFEGVPVTTDPKTGNQYRIRPGLPYDYQGQDTEIAAANDRAAKDKAVTEAARAVGGKLSLDEHAYVTANHDFKNSAKQFDGIASKAGITPDSPVYTAAQTGDLVGAHKALDDQFNTLYGSPEANATAGLFSKDLSPAAQAYRTQLDQDKAQAHKTLDSMLTAKARAQGAQARADATRQAAQALQTERTNAALRAAGMPELDASTPASQSTAAPAEATNAAEPAPSETTADQPTPDQAQYIRDQISAAQSGQKPYAIDKDLNVKISDDKPLDSFTEAVKDGILPNAPPEVWKALEEKQKLIEDAGSHPEIKAALAGAGRGAAFMAAAPLGAGIATLIPGVGEAGGIGQLLGGLATGSLAAYGYGKAVNALAAHNDTINSFVASQKLHPYYAAGGELATFAAGLPRAAMKAVGGAFSRGADAAAEASAVPGDTAAAIRAALNPTQVGANMAASANTADAAARASSLLDSIGSAYASSGGGALKTYESVKDMLETAAIRGDSTAQKAAMLAKRAGTAAAGMVAIDTALKEGSHALGFSDEHQTIGGAGVAAMLGLFAMGHGVEARDYDHQEVGNIILRGLSHAVTNTPMEEKVDLAKLAGTKGITGQVSEHMTGPLTPEEEEIYRHFNVKANQLISEGKISGDPTLWKTTAKQILFAGRKGGLAGVDISEAPPERTVTGTTVGEEPTPSEKPVSGREITQGEPNAAPAPPEPIAEPPSVAAPPASPVGATEAPANEPAPPVASDELAQQQTKLKDALALQEIAKREGQPLAVALHGKDAADAQNRINVLTGGQEGQQAAPQAQPVAEQQSAAPAESQTQEVAPASEPSVQSVSSEPRTSPALEPPIAASPEAPSPTETQPIAESPVPAPSEPLSSLPVASTPKTSIEPATTGEIVPAKQEVTTKGKSPSAKAIAQAASSRLPVTVQNETYENGVKYITVRAYEPGAAKDSKDFVDRWDSFRKGIPKPPEGHRLVGWAKFESLKPGQWNAQNVEVHTDFRRKGIATELYNKVENELGTKVVPSPANQTPEAKAFWENRQKNTPNEPAPAKVSLQSEKPTDVLHSAKNVKITAPKGAKFLQVVDNKGRKITEPIDNVAKGLNPFHQAGPFKSVTAGVLNSRKELVPLKGPIEITDANAEKEAPTKESRTEREAKAAGFKDAADESDFNQRLDAADKKHAAAVFKQGPSTEASTEAFNVAKLAKAALTLHHPELDALGHPHEFETGTTRAVSGIETDVASKRIRIDPEKLAKETAKLTPSQRMEWIKRAVAHEVIHVGTLKYAEESAANRENLMGLTKDDELMKRAAEAYGPEWKDQSDFAKAAEAARMLIEGPEKLTEASYKFLKDFLEWLKSKLKNLSKDAREVIRGIEEKLGRFHKEAEATKENAPPDKRGSTQVTLADKDAEPIRDFVKGIPESELYHGEEGSDSYGPEYGRELESHVTSLYGLVKGGDTPKAVASAVEKAGIGPVKLTLGKMSVFNNPDSPYDVLKLDVESPDLHALNSALKKLPFKSDFPDYHPHLTLAYLKKGEAAKYVGDDRFEGKQITIDQLTHSSAAREKTQIPLSAETPGTPENLRTAIAEERAKGDPDKIVDGLEKELARKEKKTFKRKIPEAPGGVDAIERLTGEIGKIKHPEAARREQLRKEGKTMFQKTTNLGGEWDGWNNLPPMLRKLVFSNSSALNPDGAARDAYRAGIIAKESPDALLDALKSAWQTRLSARTGDKLQAKEIKTAEKQGEQFKKDIANPKSGSPVNTGDLARGDTVDVNGQVLKVIDVDEDGNVTLEDHSRYGIQTVEDGHVIYGELTKGKAADEGWPDIEKEIDPVADDAKIDTEEKAQAYADQHQLIESEATEPAAQSSPEQTPARETDDQREDRSREAQSGGKEVGPKLRAGKNADDLLQGENDVFNLVSETAKDKAARLKRELAEEQANAVKESALAKAKQEKNQRPLFAAKPEDQGPFYSQLTRTVESLPQATMTTAQAKAAISKGAKPDEIKASGIFDDPLSPLAGKGPTDKVTRYELASYAVDRQTKVQDVTLGEQEGRKDLENEIERNAAKWNVLPEHAMRMADELDDSEIDDHFNNPELAEWARRYKYAGLSPEGMDGDERLQREGTQFSQYQLPGAEPDSYREQFVTWPQKRVWLDGSPVTADDIATQHGRDSANRVASPADGEPDWSDGHAAYGDIANPIVRIRRNIRTDSDGKRTYFIEEMQGPQKSEQEKMPEEVRKRIYEIGMKRAIRDAVDSGSDAIGWTTGEQQAERYDLSKQIGRIEIQKTGKPNQEYLAAYDHEGRRVIDKIITPDEKENYIGKELAHKMEAMPWTPYDSETARGETISQDHKEISGVDLKVGGEGLKALYDKMLPGIANKLAQKVGGKVGIVKSGGHPPDFDGSGGIDAETIHSMDIPEKWKEEKPQFALYAATPSDKPTPEGETPEATPPPSAQQPNPLSPEGTLPTSELSEAQRNEKLMEEAEAAGLAPSIETIKGLITNKPETIAKLRAMIKDRTGKDALNAAAPETLGAANPAQSMRDTYDSLADAMTARAAKKEVAFKQDAVGNLANYYGQQAGDSIRLDLPEKADRDAMPFVIEAGGDVKKLNAMDQKIVASTDPNLSKKYGPIIDHAINNFDRLNKARANHDRMMKESVAELKANGVDLGEVENYVTRKLDAPDAVKDVLPNPLFGMGGGGGGSKYFAKGRAFETLADAIKAGYPPVSTDLADLDAHRIEAGKRIVLQKQLFDELRKTPSPTDGKPIIGEMEQRKTLSGKTEASIPRGYSVVQAGGQPLVIHNDFAGLFRNLYGSSALRNNAAGRAAIKAAALVKHGTLAVDTFHIGRMLFKMATAGGGGPFTARNGHLAWNIHKGRALLEYNDADLGRAQAMGDITKKEADYARTNRPKIEKLMKFGMNVGKVADNLMEQAKLHLPIVSKLNSWIFGKLSRSAMLQASLVNLDRNLKNPNYTEDQAYRQTAKEMNELFGNLQNQGILQNKTLQDLTRLIFLAPNWTESQFRNEGRAYAQAGKSAFNAARGKGVRIGNSTRIFAAGLTALLAANQVINYLSRGQSTFQNEEHDHKLDAWLPGGKRGFWFSPLEIAGEYAHAAMKYLAQHENPVDVATHIASNKLSPLARAAKEGLTGRDYSGKHFLTGADRARASITDALPVPMFTQPFMEKDPRSPTGFRQARTPAAGEKQFLQSVGMKLTAAQSPRSAMFAIAQPFRPDRGGSDTAGEYTSLRQSLDNDDTRSAKSEIEWLYKQGKDRDAIMHAVGFRKDGSIAPELFAGSADREKELVASLKPSEMKVYMAAQKDHRENATKLANIISTVTPPQSSAKTSKKTASAWERL